MATITPANPSAAGASVTFAAATAGGDTLTTTVGGPKTILIVRNGAGSAITVTLAGVVNCSQGYTHNVTVSCAAGADTDITIPSNVVNPTTGAVGVTYSSATSVTVAAVTET